MIPSCPDCGKPLPPNGPQHSHDNSANSFYNPDPDDPDDE